MMKTHPIYAALVFVLLAGPSRSQPATVLLPGNFGAQAMTNVQIPVTVTDFDSVCNISLVFSYDTTVLAYTGYTIHPLMGALNAGYHSGNQFRFAWASLYSLDLADNDTLIRINFIYLGGSTSLDWDLSPDQCVIGDCNTGIKPTSWVNGEVIPVQGFGEIAGTLKYDNISQSPMPMATVILNDDMGNALDTVFTDNSGFYSFQVGNTGSYTLTVVPSLQWNSVNSNDALRILQHFVGVSPLSGLALTAADVNLNNAVNSSDALTVLKRFVGMQNSFPSGDWVFDIPPINMASLTNLIINVKALLYGDVDRSFVP